MPTLAEKLKRTVFKGRAIAGTLGFRPHSAKLVFEWADPTTGMIVTRQEIPLVEAGGQPPRIERVKYEDIPFGNAPGNIMKIGPMTPIFSGGGLDPTHFTRDLEDGESRIVIITGPECPAPGGERFVMIRFEAMKALRLVLYVQAESEAFDGLTNG
jgi:hypothetical protein